MKIRSFSYFMDEAFRNALRNSLMSITSIITVSACVFMLIFLFGVAVNVDSFLVQMEETTGVLTVIIEDDATSEQVSELYNLLDSIEHVEKVEYISSQQAMQDFKDRLGDELGLLDGLENENVLRRRFTLSLEAGKYNDAVIARLEQIKADNPAVAKLNHFKDMVDNLAAASNIIRIACVLIILILFFLAVVIIINTIKLAVNSRRAEIEIMKFVGATDWFIKWPFVIEGLLIGAAGSIFPLFFVIIGYEQLIGIVTRGLGGLGMAFNAVAGIEIFQIVIPVSVIFGCLIGVIGSLVSIRRYLDV